MHATALMREIEGYYADMRASNPMFVGARNGTLDEGRIRVYLENIHYLIRHTPLHLSLARDEARRRGLDALADFFGAKIAEEDGHDAWAKADLDGLEGAASPGPARPAGAMSRLVDHSAAAIRTDPRLYLVYILFAEYMTVLCGDAWVRDLEARCGIPAGNLTVVTRHSELDRAHVEDDIRAIDELLAGDVDLGAARRVMHGSMQLFREFGHEVFG